MLQVTHLTAKVVNQEGSLQTHNLLQELKGEAAKVETVEVTNNHLRTETVLETKMCLWRRVTIMTLSQQDG